MNELDPVIHAPKRLRIMTILHASNTAQFAYLQEQLQLAAPDLSKQMRALADAGYVRISKTGKGPGSSTWFRLTRQGRAAYQSYIAALRALIDAPPDRDADAPSGPVHSEISGGVAESG